MNRLIYVCIIIFIFTIFDESSFAQNKYEFYIHDWEQKSTLAKQNLNQAIQYLKQGEKVLACKYQRIAGNYGVEALKSLLIAFEDNQKIKDIDEFLKAEEKWKQIRDKCN